MIDLKKRSLIGFLVFSLFGYGIYKGFRHYKKERSRVLSRIAALEEGFLEVELKRFYRERGVDLNRFYVNDGYRNPNAYIAHGGGVGNFTYTNSREGVLNALKEHKFKFIELDFLETSDGWLVGGHDWKWFRRMTKVTGEGALKLNEARELLIEGKYHPIFAEDVRSLMKENEDFFILTDKIKKFNLLVKELGNIERLIVEVFDPVDYVRAIAAGVKYPVFCIAKPELLHVAKKYRFPIVTMDAAKFFDSEENIQKVQQLHDDGVTIFLYWNDYSFRDEPTWIRKYLGRTVSKIYTDKWSPEVLPE